ncbi:putative segregation and condensation protein B [Halobacteriovorax marinus SJ]|uniref:Segregation and condensation protein B n=1 Tax=Halobacteriovorax marinus (strain ATCC BAA-682 / DSM 15412 / SJ) TaxID=862908 RepID=E1X3Z6_HALMS|nr:SMC-Scp complex subunit ScpB [Halobacteriovorax marinus]CBW25336.1 putative segregation and condensation protein B [Halobacteriovorax marinus SJ]
MDEMNETEIINDEILNQIENIVIEDELIEMSASEIETEEMEPIFPSESDLEYPSLEMSSEESTEAGEQEVVEELDEEQEDKLWQARTGLNFETLCGAIETIIFMSDKPVPLAKIRNVIDEDLPLRVVHSSLERLQSEYELKHHGIRLQEVAEGYQFRTKATYSKYVQDLFKVNSLVLSPTALEVLAIIAYKQPVSKIEVEKIRGVDSSHIVRGLMDKRLVRVTGRSNEAGRPVLYGTTAEFLEVFNLANLDQLPPEHELEEMSQQEIGKISDIKTIVHHGDKTRFSFDEIDELDALSERIKSIDSETEFTRSLKLEEKKRRTEEGEVVKSAFDLLEEHLDNRLVTNANEDSLASEVFTAITDPQVIKDLTAGPFNMPEMIDEEEDDFQMIDLDTGEVITDDLEDDGSVADPDEIVELDDDYDMLVDIEMSEEEIKEISEATGLPILPADEPEDSVAEVLEELVEAVSTPESPVKEQAEQTAAALFDENKDEVASLAAALDAAFANLTGSSLDDTDFEESEANVEEKASDIDSLTSMISEKAKDLDLDLGFLNDSSESERE